MDYDKYKGHTRNWRIGRDGLECLGKGVEIYGSVNGFPVATALSTYWSLEQIEANALLIADAPLLLARCLELESQQQKLLAKLKGACHQISKYGVGCSANGCYGCPTDNLIIELGEG